MSVLKKIFFLSLLLFIMSLLFWGVYNLSFKTKGQPQEKKAAEQTAPTDIPDSKKPAEPAAIAKISAEPVLFPAFSKNKINYYSQSASRFIQTDFNGESEEILLEKSYYGLENISWSPDKNKIILKLKNLDNSYSFLIHDFSADKNIPVKKNVDEVSWMADSGKIIYKYYNPATKERSLNISDPDGTNWKKLADLAFKKISTAQIPPNGYLSFWNVGDAYEETGLESVSLLGDDEKTLFKGKFGADYLWNPSGDNILISSADSKGGHTMQLATINYNGGEYSNLNIPSFISKCVWSKDGKTIYYALPGGIPDSAVLPNDYKDKKFNTADTFWKVDIQSMEKTRLVELAEIKEKYDADQLFLNEDESLLFFVNRIDSNLYKISL